MSMNFVRQAVKSQQAWVVRSQHFVLRAVSLMFSLASAHAIRWFFTPLDRVDPLQPLITDMIALGFGLLGYFVSRGLVHRLLNKQRIWSYLPICLVVELVEIFCNYMMAAVMIQGATWLQATPPGQRVILTVLAYVVLSIIPMVGLLLAVVDMDLTVSKHGSMTSTSAMPKSPGYAQSPVKPITPMVPVPSYMQGYTGANGTNSVNSAASVPGAAKANGGKVPVTPFSPVQVTN